MKRHLLFKEKNIKKKRRKIIVEEKQLRHLKKKLLNYTLNPRLVNICIHFDGDISKLYL